VALTGSPEAIKAAAKAYRVYFAKAGNGDSDTYLMDHSSFIYLMGPDGRYVRHFAHNATPEEIAGGIGEALAQG
jgi:protein SCO1/2